MAEASEHRSLTLAFLSLAADAVTAEATAALRRAGVRSILLKGPSLGRWLYGDGEERIYGDTDLLVAPASTKLTESVLTALGFEACRSTTRSDPAAHATSWVRGGRAPAVDLHHTLPGVGVASEQAWTILATETERLEVAGVDVEVLSTAGRALHVGLHAASHGAGDSRRLDDLARVLAKAPGEVWAEAAALAERLDAIPTFAAGLRLLPEGRALADRLQLPRADSAEVVLRAAGAPPLAVGFVRLDAKRGLAAKAAFLFRELTPPPAWMWLWSPLAQRGRPGLAAAYVWRPFWLLLHVIPAWRAWRRARAQVRAQERGPLKTESVDRTDRGSGIASDA